MTERIDTQMVGRVIEVLDQTTAAAADYLLPGLGRNKTLLDGTEILRLWEAFQEDHEAIARLKTQWPTRKPEHMPTYGLYFIFYRRDDGGMVPVYVGKGSLPYRPLAHLGLQRQYIDQVFAFYFGGIHARPWRLDISEDVRRRFGPLCLGLVFYSVERDKSEPARAIGDYERAFHMALHPIGNTGYYPRQINTFVLKQLVDTWPENGRDREVLPAAEIGRILQECAERHARCCEDGKRGTPATP